MRGEERESSAITALMGQSVGQSGTFRRVSTAFQEARISVGMRLRELRANAQLTGHQLAERLGWTQSKVSKLENGKQTATAADLLAWAEGTGHPEVAEELIRWTQDLGAPRRPRRGRSASASRAAQESYGPEYQSSTVLHGWESAVIADVLQTAEYARHLRTRRVELDQREPVDVDALVRSQLRRQEMLYVPGKKFHILLWEAALRALICPPVVLAAQLDRLSGVIGLDTVSLGIVPLEAPVLVPPAQGFWIHDERMVTVDHWHTTLWIESETSVSLYRRAWQALNESAVHGTEAHQLIARARGALHTAP